MTLVSDTRVSPAASGIAVPEMGQIKTILVPVAGSETDRMVMHMALALAKPFRAHLEFLHLRLSVDEAAGRTPHLDFCAGSTVRDAISHLEREQSNLAISAAHYVRRFCGEHGIEETSSRRHLDAVTGSCIEEPGPAIATMLLHARHSDVTVLGRAQHEDRMPDNLIEELLFGSGRPVLLCSDGAHDLFGTVIVGWKETPEASRALGAALPILQRSRRVVLVHVAEKSTTGTASLEQVRTNLTRQGIAAEIKCIGDGRVPASTLLPTLAAELGAGLIVVGAFGHSRLREIVFGGVTRSLIDGSSVPVFMTR